MTFRSTPAFPPHRPAVSALAVVFLAASLLAGCSSSSEDASVAGYSGPCLELTPGGAPVAGFVTLQEAAGTTCDTLEVDVMVTDVADVFNVNLNIAFDSSVVTFDGYSTSESFLGTAPDVMEWVDNSNPDTLIVSLTQISRAGADAIGTQPVIRLTFLRAADTGSTDISFTSGDMMVTTPRGTSLDLQWLDGLLDVILI